MHIFPIFNSSDYFNKFPSLFAHCLHLYTYAEVFTNFLFALICHSRCHQWRWEWYNATNIVFCMNSFSYIKRIDDNNHIVSSIDVIVAFKDMRLRHQNTIRNKRWINLCTYNFKATFTCWKTPLIISRMNFAEHLHYILLVFYGALTI